MLGADVAADVAVLARRDAPRRALADTDAAFLAGEAAEGRQTAVLADAAQLAALADALSRAGAAWRRLEPAPAA